jgi:Flp pilus assembly protein TadD
VQRVRRTAPRPVAIALSLVCLLLAASMWSAAGDERRLERANAAGLRGDYRLALHEAGAVHDDAAAPRAAVTAAYALAGMRRYRAAAVRFAAAARQEPSNWTIRRDWARVLLAAGRRPQARVQMARALALNPRLRLPPGFVRSR